MADSMRPEPVSVNRVTPAFEVAIEPKTSTTYFTRSSIEVRLDFGKPRRAWTALHAAAILLFISCFQHASCWMVNPSTLMHSEARMNEMTLDNSLPGGVETCIGISVPTAASLERG